MQFGLYIRQGQAYQGMLELTQYAEELGLFGVFLNDHIHSVGDDGKSPYLEAWTAMTGIGVETKRIRIGHIVLFNSLRNPAYLAKSIATLDQMIAGRYELLIGAGWNETEYIGYDLMEQGRGMPSAKERVDRFKESLLILRGMLTNEVFSFEGRFWKLKDAINIPQPVQKPMRMSVGASKPRMFKIAAKYADGLNIGGGLDQLEEKIDQFVPELEKNNKKLDDYFVSGFTSVNLAQNEKEYDSLVDNMAKQAKKPKDDIREFAFVGTPEVLINKFREAKDLGMKMFVLAVRPATTIEEIKDKMTLFKDSIVSQL